MVATHRTEGTYQFEWNLETKTWEMTDDFDEGCTLCYAPKLKNIMHYRNIARGVIEVCRPCAMRLRLLW